MNPRNILTSAIEGKKTERPICTVYDAFITNDAVDWECLYEKGLLVLDHIEIVDTEYPNLNISEEISQSGKHERRDVYWETDRGVLHEAYIKDLTSTLLPWRVEEFIKEDEDYKIMARALEGAEHFLSSPKHLFIDPSKNNISFSSFYQIVSMDRTPIQKVQIDFTGLEKFAIDLAFQKPELLDLIEMMNEQLYAKFNLISDSEYTDIKLWENLTIDVLGPKVYREFLVPVYQRLNTIIKKNGKRLHVHYDGKMDLIKHDIFDLGFAGIDSFSAGPEGDLAINDAVELWPDTFLWINPSSSWYLEDTKMLQEQIHSTSNTIKTNRYCFVISEDVPPFPNESINAILDVLNTKKF